MWESTLEFSSGEQGVLLDELTRFQSWCLVVKASEDFVCYSVAFPLGV